MTQEGIPMVSFSSAVSLGFQRWSDFSGRSTRAEYWWWWLFAFVVTVLAQIIDMAAGLGGVIYGIVAIVFFVPNLAVLVRRLHDVGKSGWVIFINIIPIVGWVIFFVWIVTESKADNKYGPKSGNEDNPPMEA